jgi:hypothetical protein
MDKSGRSELHTGISATDRRHPFSRSEEHSAQPVASYRPNIPGIDGIPIRPPAAIFFIIFCISRN